MKINIKHAGVLFLALVILFYLYLGLSYIRLPGLYCEEGLVANIAIEIMDIFKRNSLIDAIKNKMLPVYTSPRSGALEAYILLPFFYVFGINTEALRLESLTAGIFTIVLTYLFTRELFNRKIAFLATTLLVINPGFFISIKTGTDSASLLQAFSLVVFFCFLKWYRRKNNLYFYLGMFLLGLGMNIRIWFLWVLTAACASAAVFFKDAKKMILASRRGPLKFIAGATGAFIAGATLFFYNDLYLYFLNLAPAFKDMVSGDQTYLYKNYGILSVSRNYWQNLLYVVNEFNSLISGSCFFQPQLDISPDVSKLYPSVFWGACAALLLLLVLKKISFRKEAVFLLLIFSAIFAQTPLFIFRPPTAVTHFPILYSLPQIIISAAAFSCARYLRKVKIVSALIVILILAAAIENVSVVQKYLQSLKRLGGIGDYSDAIYRLSGYLEEEKYFAPVVLSHGIHYQLPVTSGGIIHPIVPRFVHLSYRSGKDEFVGMLKEKCNDSASVYIAYTREYDYGVPSGLEVLKSVAKEMGKSVVEEKKFYQRDGKRIYSVYRVQ